MSNAYAFAGVKADEDITITLTPSVDFDGEIYQGGFYCVPEERTPQIGTFKIDAIEVPEGVDNKGAFFHRNRLYIRGKNKVFVYTLSTVGYH